MHQDEDNQAAQAEPVSVPEPDGQPESVLAPDAPATAFDPTLESAAVDATDSPQLPAAEESVEATVQAVADARELDVFPAIGESHDSKPAWMSSEHLEQPTPESIAAEEPIPATPPVVSPSGYSGEAWSASNAGDSSAATETGNATELPYSEGPLETAGRQTYPAADTADSFATDQVAPPPPPVWVTTPLSDAPAAESEREAPTYERPAEPHIEMPQGGPNWMLAFVCGWAAFTSFMEAPVAYAAKETMINGSAVTLTAGDRLYGGLGFGLLGLGLLLFGIEALLWGRRRRGASALLSIGLPVLVSLAGVVCLILSHYPGSRI